MDLRSQQNSTNISHPIFLHDSSFQFSFIFIFKGKYIFLPIHNIPSEKMVIKYWSCEIKSHKRIVYIFTMLALFDDWNFFMSRRDYLLRVEKNEDISLAAIRSMLSLWTNPHPTSCTTKKNIKCNNFFYGISFFLKY